MLQITSKQAQAIISAGEAKAVDIGVPVNITVLDAGAHLKAFSRMDGAVLGSIDIATRKARTAALSRPPARPSGNIASRARPPTHLNLRMAASPLCGRDSAR